MTSNSFAPIDNLRHRLTRPGPWAERLRRLTQDIASSAESDTPSSPDEPQLTCEECDTVLDRFVDDELNDFTERTAQSAVRGAAPNVHDAAADGGWSLFSVESLNGQTAGALSRRVWAHLKDCVRCRQSYGLLLDTLVQESAGQLTAIQRPADPPLSFLCRPNDETPWVARLRSQLVGSSFGLTISFSLSYLRTLLAPPRLLVRAGYTPTASPTTYLLLSDLITIGEQPLAVEVTATRESQRPDWFTIQSVLTGPEALFVNVRAKLTWAGETYLAPVDANGTVSFGEVPLQALRSESHDFRIAFEVREPVDAADQSSD
jgi:hypothetical protein